MIVHHGIMLGVVPANRPWIYIVPDFQRAHRSIKKKKTVSAHSLTQLTPFCSFFFLKSDHDEGDDEVLTKCYGGAQKEDQEGTSQKVGLEWSNEGVRFPLGGEGVFISSNT